MDAAKWTLRVEGSGVCGPVGYRYDELWNQFPLVSVIRTIECAGNRRVLLGDESGSHSRDPVGAGRDRHGRVDRGPAA